MGTLVTDLDAFLQEHRRCGEVDSGVKQGRVWIRWDGCGAADWQPLSPKLVVEVRYDHVTGGRFRHGTRFLRWRPDKKPSQCTMDQTRVSGRPAVLTEDGRLVASRPGASPRRKARIGPPSVEASRS